MIESIEKGAKIMGYGPVSILALLVLAGLVARPAWPGEMLLSLLPQFCVLAILLAIWLFGLGRPAPALIACGVAFVSLCGITLRTVPTAEPLQGEPNIRIVWANVFGRPQSLEQVFAFAQSKNADLVIIGEHPKRTGPSTSAAAAPFLYRRGRMLNEDTYLSVYSRVPLSDFEIVEAAERRGLVFRAQTSGGAPLRIGVVHPKIPASPDGTAKRARQLDSVFSRVALEKDALILGDFNTVPWSPALIRIANTHDAAHVPTNTPTWMSRIPGAGLPIDLVFTRGKVCARAETGPGNGSDHFPVFVEVNANRAP